MISSAPAALQRQFPISDPLLCVLVTINGAREREAFRNYDTEDFHWLINERYLVAFDISVLGEKGRDREWRILPHSLDHYAKTNGNPKARGRTGSVNPYAATWDHIILKNHHEQNISSPRAGVILNCSPDHITKLIDARLLKTVVAYSRGRNGAAVITRDSFLSFLKSRLEGLS
jgi:hypothetical protein